MAECEALGMRSLGLEVDLTDRAATDVAFREDECRTGKDHSARNLAMIRRAALNMLRREPARMSLKRKRLKAALNPAFRAAILAR